MLQQTVMYFSYRSHFLLETGLAQVVPNHSFFSNRLKFCVLFRWLKIAIPPLYSVPPLGVKPSDLRNNPWRRKL